MRKCWDNFVLRGLVASRLIVLLGVSSAFASQVAACATAGEPVPGDAKRAGAPGRNEGPAVTAEPSSEKDADDPAPLFEVGVLLKPKRGSEPDVVSVLAPLMIRSVDPGWREPDGLVDRLVSMLRGEGDLPTEREIRGEPTHPTDGTFAPLDWNFLLDLVTGGLAFESGETSERPVMYFDVDGLHVGNELFERTTYAWIERETLGSRPSARDRLYAIRATVGHDGFPLIWEVFEARTGFVETRVADGLGAALRGDQPTPSSPRSLHTIEPRYYVPAKADEPLGTYVMGTFRAGPVPMGPYLYVNYLAADQFQGMHCRCEPVRVDRFVEEQIWYDLRPFDELGELAQHFRERWRPLDGSVSQLPIPAFEAARGAGAERNEPGK